MSPTQAWRILAKSFNIISRLVQFQRLSDDFSPEDAIALHEEPISTHERSVLSFLLHVWNRYDFPFELSEVVLWGPQHQQAFRDWVNGKTLGTPCRYF